MRVSRERAETASEPTIACFSLSVCLRVCVRACVSFHCVNRHILNLMRKSQALHSIAELVEAQCDQQQSDIKALEEHIANAKLAVSRFKGKGGKSNTQAEQSDVPAGGATR